MAGKREQMRLIEWKDLEESYFIKHGNFRVFVEVPQPENNESRSAAKNVAIKIKDLLEADKKKND